MYLCLVSLVDPGVSGLSVVAEISASEPEPDLVVGGLHGVGAVDDVASNLDNKAFNITDNLHESELVLLSISPCFLVIMCLFLGPSFEVKCA